MVEQLVIQEVLVKIHHLELIYIHLEEEEVHLQMELQKQEDLEEAQLEQVLLVILQQHWVGYQQ